MSRTIHGFGTFKVKHNERLEFLGDAVVEFITSVHLFYMFPDLEEGGLATYRAALVQNQHLAILAQVDKDWNYSIIFLRQWISSSFQIFPLK